MTENQKIVKNIAKLLAGVIIILIIAGAISFALRLVEFIFIFTGEEPSNELSKIYEGDSIAVKSMSIDLDASSLTIKTGESLYAESNGKRVTVKESNGTLYISEKKAAWFVNSNSVDIILYIPEGMFFDKIDLDTGAAKVDIEYLEAKEIDIELGAGKVTINKLIATENASIDGGAGNFDIHDGSIRNLEMDWGVGNAEITAEILGESDIESGVGNLDLDLIGTADNYKIYANKGLGNFIVGGENVSDGDKIGNGSNALEIDCGVGNIIVNFKDK